jgi:phage/plasmid-associated DNA primase
LTPPAGVAAATNDYRTDSNPLLAWVEDSCTVEHGATTTAKDLRDSYVEWHAADRYRGKPIAANSPRWKSGLETLGCKPDRDTLESGRARIWRGIRLNAAESGLAL